VRPGYSSHKQWQDTKKKRDKASSARSSTINRAATCDRGCILPFAEPLAGVLANFELAAAPPRLYLRWFAEVVNFKTLRSPRPEDDQTGPLSTTAALPSAGRELDARWTFKLRGFFGVLFLAPAGFLTLFSEPVVREGTWSNIVFDALAWLVFLSGVLFRSWATLYVGSRKLKTLVDQGPYSVCRNPLYVGTFLMSFGAALFLKSFVLAAAVAILMIAYTLATVPTEEDALRRVHGAAYDAYLKRVPRYIPSWRLFETPESVEVKVSGVRIEAKRLLGWVFVPILAEIVAHLRVQPWWPHWFRLF
jgi:protein-S-isoprenylcysteine O-methyltransferase Ste14